MRIGLCCVSIILLSAATQAATLQHSQGQVLINQGSGFRPAAADVVIKPGDRIMATPGARVVIAYNKQCKMTLEPGAVVTVPAQPPCEKTAFAPPAKLGGCSLKDDPDGCRIEPEREDYTHLLIVGGAIGLAVGGLLLLEDNGASP